MSERCFICGEDNPTVIQKHHVVPRRYGGSDAEENLVALCANCHEAVEKMYDERFFKRLGVAPSVSDSAGVMGDYVNKVDEFVNSSGIVETGTGMVKKDVLYEQFRKYCSRNGYTNIPAKNAFGEALSRALEGSVESTQRRIQGSRRRVYIGIKIADGCALT